MEQCGFDGMTELQCMEEWNCCYDKERQIPCFKPKVIGSEPLHPGITAGAAVATFLVCVGIAAGGFFYYKNYGLALPGSAVTPSFGNPMA